MTRVCCIISFVIFLVSPLHLFAQPANDDCANATPLTIGTNCVNTVGTNVAATDSGINPSCANFSGGDVWFSVVVPASGAITVTLSDAGGFTDSGMSIYDGCGGTEIECDDDDGPGLMSEIILTGQTPGVTLYIAVWEWGNNSFGNFNICVTEPPVATNDDCASAIPITVNSSCVNTTGTNEGASDSGINPTCANFSGGDVWYSVVVPPSGNVTVTLSDAGGFTDSGMAIYNSCGGAQIACDDDGALGLFSEIELTGQTPGATLYIAVWEWGNNSFGPFNICATEPADCSAVTNMDCTGATVVCDNNNIVFTPCGVGVDDFASPSNDPDCLSFGENESAWYYFEIDDNAPPNQTIEFDINPTGGLVDYDFAVYGPDVDCGALGSPIRCSYAAGDGITGVGSGASDFSEGATGDGYVAAITVQPGEGYFVLVDNYSADATGFDLSWGGTAADDLDCSADPCAVTVTISNILCDDNGTPCDPSDDTFTFDALVEGVNGGTNWSANDPNNESGTFGSTVNFGPFLISGGDLTITFSDTSDPANCFEDVDIVAPPTCSDGTPPVVSASANDASCGNNNGDVTISWTGGTPTFDITGDLTQNNATSPHTFTMLGMGTYTVTVTDSDGCTDTATVMVNDTPGPIVTGSGVDATCGDNNGEVTISWTGGTPNYNITGDLTGTNVSSPQVFSNLPTGTYNVTVTDDNGCTDTASIIIGDSPDIAPMISSTDATCGNTDGTITVSWTGGTSPVDITGDLIQSSASNPHVFTNLGAGTYNLVVTDANGCSGTVSATINSFNGPMASFTQIDPTCGLMNGSITISWTGGTANFDISGDLNQTNASSPHTFNMLGAGSYTVVVTDANSCTSELMITLTDTPGPILSLSSNDPTCGLNNGDITVTWTNGVGPFNISGDLIMNGASSPQTFTNLAPGTYNLIITDANGCTDSESITITDQAGPMASANAMDALCGNTDGSVTISWSGGTAPLDITGDLIQTNASSPETFSNLAAGTYTVTVTDANGCSDVVSATVNDVGAPMASASATDASCGNNNGTITLSWTGGTGPYNIFGDESVTGATSPHVFINLPSGSYNFVVTDANGCSDTAMIIIGDTAGPDISGTAGDANCGMPDGYITVTWTGGTGPFDLTGDINLTNASSPQQETGLASGNYTVTVTDVNGCTDEVMITVGDIPGPDLMGVPTNANCGNSDGEITFTWSGGTGPYDLSGDLNQSNATSPQNFSNLSSGNYNVVITDANGCTDDLTVMVGDSPDVMANGIATNTTCGNNDGTVTISWSGGTGPFDISGDLNLNNASSPETFTGLSSNTYTVTVTDANGCTDTATATVGNANGPTGSSTFIDANCGNSDGSITISWTGGTGPYDINGDLTQTNASSPEQFDDLSSGTYTVTISDTNGCTSLVSTTISDIPGPDPSATSQDETCSDSNGSITVTWTDGTAPFDITGDVSQTGASSPVMFDDLPNGTYTIIVTDANGCSNTTSATINDQAGPMASASQTDATCGNADGSVTFSWTGGIAPFDISGDFTFANAMSPQLFSGLSTGTYTVTITDSNGCTDTASVMVGDIPGPDISATATDASCGNSDGTITVNWSGGAGPFDISGDINMVGASSPEQFTNLPTGIYNITITDANGCTDDTMIEIMNTAGPMASASSTDANCGNADGTVTISWTGGQSPYDIAGDLNLMNANSPEQFTDLSSGTYFVTVTDANGCTDTASVDVGDSPDVSASATATNTTCGSNDGTVTISWTGGTGPFDITGDLNLSNASSPETFMGLSSGTYTVTVTDVNGCTGTASVSIGNDNGPTASMTNFDPTCGNNDGEIQLTWMGGLGPYSVTGDFTLTNANSPETFSNLLAGSYTVTVTDANGCTSVASTTLTDIPGPDLSTNTVNTICSEANGSITLSWSDGTGPFDITGDLTQSNASSPEVFNDLLAGSYTVTITDANGCSDTETINLTDSPGPIMSSSSMDATCGISNGSITLSWTNGNGPFDITGDLNLSNASSPQSFTGLASGTYNLLITDANGCTDDLSVVISDTTGPQVNMVATDANCGNADGSVTISWSDGVGPFDISGDFNLVNASSPQQFNALSSGLYSVVVTDGNGCTGTASVTVNDVPGPDANVITTSANCGNADGTASISWTGGTAPYNITGDLSASNVSSAHLFSNLASGNYNIVITDVNGCTDDIMILINDTPSLSANATSTNSSCGNNDGSMTISWSGGTGPFDITGDLNQTNASSPHTFMDLSSGTYNVTVTDVNGCTDIATATIGNSNGPTASASSTDATCSNANGTVSITWNGGVGPFSISGDLTQTNASSPQVFSNLPAGNYNVIVTDGNGCTSVASATIMDLAGPIAQGTEIDATCGNANGTLIITWTDGIGPFEISGDLNQTNANSPHTFNGLSAGTYSIMITDANGCTDNLNLNIGDSAAPTLNASSLDASCGNNDGSITLSWTGGTGPFDISGDLNLTNANSPQVFNGLFSGSYDIIITDANGCTDMVSVIIGDTSGPLLDASGQNANCGNSDGIITLTWVGGQGPYNITGDLNLTNASSPEQFIGLPSGTYSVTITDVNGCTDEAIVPIFDDPGPSLNLSSIDANCGNPDGSITATWSNGTGPFDISGDLSQSNASSPHQFNNVASGVYTLIVTDVNGCTSSQTTIINDTPGLSANGTATNTSCGSSDGSVTVSWSGGTGPYDITGDLTQTNAISPFQFNMLGSGTYNLLVTDANGCTDDLSATVGNTDGPTASASSSDANCGNMDGIVIVSWGGGTGPYDITGDLAQANATSPQIFNNLSGGNFNIIVTDANGCSSQASAIVNDSPGPVLSNASTDASCGVDNGVIIFNWTDGTGPFDLSGDLNATNITTPYIVNNLSSGTYNVTLTDANGCSSMSTAVIGNSNGPSFVTNFSDENCSNMDGTITLNWGGGTGPFNITGDLSLTNATSPQLFTGLASGTYNLTLTDSNNCSSEHSITIENVEGPILELTSSVAFCGNSNGNVIVNWTGGDGPYNITGDFNLNDASSPQVFMGVGTGMYSIIITDANNCSSADQIEVTEESGPDLMAVSESTSCGEDNGSISISWTDGTGPFNLSGDITAIGVSQNQNFTDLSSGQYNLILTDANDCTSEFMIEIEDSESVSLTSSATNTSCGVSDGTITLEWVGGTSPFEISGDLQASNAMSPYTFQSLGSGFYNLVVTDADGCSSTVSATIGNTDGPTASASSSEEHCDLSDGSVTIDWNGGTGPYDITGDLNQTNVTAPFVFDNLEAGSYSIIVTDINGCSSIASTTVNELDGPMVSGQANSTSCGNDDGEITITWTNGEGPFTLTGDLSAQNITSPHVISDLTVGNYILTITDINNCNDEITIEITNQDGPTATATATEVTCGNSDGIVTVDWTGGEAPYDITGDLVQFSATAPFDFTGLSIGSYDIVVTDANGCSSPVSVMVTNSDGPVPTAMNTDATCGNADGTIVIEWTGGEAPYDISGDLNSLNVVSPSTFTDLPSGEYNLIVTDFNGCSASVNVEILDQGGPLASISGIDANCGMTDGSITIEWSDGQAPFNISGDLNQMNASSPAVFSSLSAGLYEMIVTDASGCSVEVFYTIDDIDNLELTLTESQATCGLANGSLIVSWTGGTANFNISGDLTATNVTSPHIFTDLGSSDYQITIIDANGCMQSDMITLGSTPEVNVSCSELNPASAPGALDGEAEIMISDGTEPFQLDWDGPDSNDGSLNALSSGVTVLSALTEGDYTVLVTDANGCTTNCVFSISGTGCELEVEGFANDVNCFDGNDGSIEMTVSGANGNVTYSWDVSGVEGEDPEGLSPGIYTVTIEDEAACSIIETFVIENGIEYNINLMANPMVINLGDSTILETNTDLGEGVINQIMWTGEAIECDSCLITSVMPDETTEYAITLIDDNGCEISASIIVQVIELGIDVYVPNVFHPDGDGMNDYFFPMSADNEIESVNYMTVFDRWGNRIFHREKFSSGDPSLGWDGLFKGNEVNPGVFVYLMEVVLASGEIRLLKGDVTVIR